ncbi:MAG: trigger factor [Parcubacteria group bacterium]
MTEHFENIKSTSLPNSEVEISGSLTVEFLNECRKDALKALNERSELPGFRKGFVPEDVLVKRLGEMSILEETAEVALGKEYKNILKEAEKEKKLETIGRPQISITKMVPGSPLEFKIKVTLLPEFALPDYKTIALSAMKQPEDSEVTPKEVEDVLRELTKRDIKPDLKEGETLEGRVRENLEGEKNFRAKEKNRILMMEELVKVTDIEVPELLITSELEKMMGQFKDDVARFGKKFDEYLKEIKKTEEEIKKEWRENAIKRVKGELIVSKIAETEKIEPSEDDLEKETKHLLSHYPDAEPLRARVYVYEMLRNQKVLEFLESLK